MFGNGKGSTMNEVGPALSGSPMMDQPDRPTKVRDTAAELADLLQRKQKLSYEIRDTQSRLSCMRNEMDSLYGAIQKAAQEFEQETNV